MQKYIGVKLIHAEPMTREQYNEYRGWELPVDEIHLKDEPGYLVEYIDSGRGNDSRHLNYISWSPADVFDKSYRPTEEMNFGLAIEAAKMGEKVARKGWNGKGIHIFLMDEAVGSSRPSFDGENCNERVQQFLAMDTTGLISDNEKAPRSVVPWLASQTDMLADDWFIV